MEGEWKQFLQGGAAGAAAAAAALAVPKEKGVPRMYRRPRLRKTQTSKGYVGATDYSRYNSLQFAGLEADMPNAYANSVLQLLYFLPAARARLLAFVSHPPELPGHASRVFVPHAEPSPRTAELGKGVPVVQLLARVPALPGRSRAGLA